jgi:hypothetical protein
MTKDVSMLVLIIILLQCQFSRCLLSTAVKLRPIDAKTWINDNVRVLEPSVKRERNPFGILVPLLGKGCDVTVDWDDPHKGALELATKFFERNAADGEVVAVLVEAFGQFRNLTVEEGITATSFKARIVATRGSIGIKCPRWHYDHVPVRHIQALVGPGCDYVVSENGVDRSVLNQADECETERINRHVVDDTVADVRRGREGEAVVLRGMTGCDRPAVHKSPELPWWQGRILVTLDIV